MSFKNRLYILFSLVVIFVINSSVVTLAEDNNGSVIHNVAYSYSGDLGSSSYQFCYSDSMLIGQNSNEFSGELAKASIGLAASAYGKEGEMVKNALISMGFYEENITDKGSYEVETSITSNDSVAYMIAKKKVGDYYIYIVPVRGTPTSAEWYSNFNLGDREDGYHAGFYQAAIDVMGNLMEVIKQDGADKEHTIIWTMGHSRGAAVANIIAGEMSLKAKYASPNHIFGYTYACPAVKENINYSHTNIYNYNYSGDLIPELPLAEWGYDRYGVTIDFMEEDPDGKIFENELLQFKRITTKEFSGVTSTKNYLNLLKEFVADKETFNTPEGKFAFTILAWFLENKKTSKEELIGYIGMNISNDYSDMISQEINDNVDFSNSLKKEAVLDLQDKVADILEQMDGKTQNEQDTIMSQNSQLIDKLEKRFEIEIINASDILKAKKRIDSCIVSIDKVNGIYGCIMSVFIDAENNTDKVADAIKHGHTPETYIVWMNSLYWGYKGWIDNESVEILNTDINIIKIGEECFENCLGLNEFIIPSCVMAIGNESFKGSGIEKLIINGGETKFGARCFYDCNNLKEVVLPIDVEYSYFSSGGMAGYGYYEYPTFSGVPVEKIYYTKGNTGKLPDRSVSYEGDLNYYRTTLEYVVTSTLKSVEFEEGITEIGNYMFYNAAGYPQIENIKFASTITKIGDYAFSYLQGGFSLYNNSIEEIGVGAFYNSSGLEGIDFVDGIKDFPQYSFYKCSGLKGGIKIPSSVGLIGTRAFYYCEGIEELIIEGGETDIQDRCFYDCKKLKEVVIPADAKCTSNSFEDTAVEKVTYTKGYSGIIPDGSFDSISYSACNTIKEIIVDEGITKIGDRAFHYNMSVNTSGILESVTFPTSLKEIGDEVFWREVKLTNIILPDGLEKLGERCFDGCVQLVVPEIPSSLTEIPYSCFENCKGKDTLVIPSTVKVINGCAFYSCDDINNVYLPCDVECKYSCFDSTNTKKLVIFKNSINVIPDGFITSIVNDCFHDDLKTIEIGEGITEIGNNSFSDFANAIIPNSVIKVCGSDSGRVLPRNVYGYKKSYIEDYINELNIKQNWNYCNFIPFDYPVIDNLKYEYSKENWSDYCFSCKVYSDVNVFSENVKWSINGNTSDDTNISQSGELKLGEDESSITIDIIAESEEGNRSIYELAVTYYAKFDGNGTDEYDCECPYSNGSILYLPDCRRKNYIFDGWYTDIIGGEKITEDSTISGNIILYAHWKKTVVNDVYISFEGYPMVNKTLGYWGLSNSSEIENDTVCINYYIGDALQSGVAKCNTTYKIVVKFKLKDGYDIDDNTIVYINNMNISEIEKNEDIYSAVLFWDTTDHDWGEWSITIPATETQKGVETRVCRFDETHVQTREIPEISHTHTPVKVGAKVASCTEVGNIEYWTCEGCDKLFEDSDCKTEINVEDTVKAKISHTPVASSKEKEVKATCETDGSYEEVVKCSICGEEMSRKTVTVHATGHDWGEWVQTKAPTETTEGEFTRTCKNDETHKETKAIPVTTHEHNISFVDEISATCTANGIKAHFVCSGCGLLFEDEAGTKMIMDEQSLIIKKGHKGGFATCIHKAICDVCHEGYGELAPSNHARETEIKNKVDATCTTDGYTGDTYCKDCGELISNGEVITSVGHKTSPAVKENEFKATCEKDGSYEEVVKCSVCGEEISRKMVTVHATGHDFGEWETKKNPTETSEGLEERVCKKDASHKETRINSKIELKPVTDDKTLTGDNTRPAITETIKASETPAAKDTTLIDESTKATFTVTSSAGDEPTVEYNSPPKTNNKTVTILESVTLNGVTYKITEIADNAFANNKTVEKVIISSNIETIGDGAFSGCTKLKSVSIPTNVTEIGAKAFKGCTSLTSIKTGNGVAEIGDSAFEGCKKLKSVTIGSNVNEIGDNAFANCLALTKLTIPAKVTKLGKNAFKGSKKIKIIIIKTIKLTDKTVSKNAFKGVGNKVTIKVPKKMKKAYTKLFRNKGLSKKIKVK